MFDLSFPDEPFPPIFQHCHPLLSNRLTLCFEFEFSLLILDHEFRLLILHSNLTYTGDVKNALRLGMQFWLIFVVDQFSFIVLYLEVPLLESS